MANLCALYSCVLISAVFCEIIVQIPDDELRYEWMNNTTLVDNSKSLIAKRKFNIFWNVPTMQCTSKGIKFDDLEEYGIITNKGGSFRGDRISILYDPGVFPALLRNSTQNEYYFRNGGVPQEGNLEIHLDMIKKHIGEQIPDENYEGLGIINFESWKPIFRQNHGNQQPYQEVSIDIETRRHPFWIKSWVQKEAARRLEEAGRVFMEDTISLIKKLRPKAKWSYYAYPYCYNMGETYKHQNCPDQVRVENDRLKWLWDQSTVLYPSVYLAKRLTSPERIQLIKGRIKEAKRVNDRLDIYPYTWYKYIDDMDSFITKDDFANTMKELHTAGVAGAIIWGSSNDVNTKEKCTNLKNYVAKVIGPISAKYTIEDDKNLKQLIKPKTSDIQRSSATVKTDLEDGAKPTDEESEERIFYSAVKNIVNDLRMSNRHVHHCRDLLKELVIRNITLGIMGAETNSELQLSMLGLINRFIDVNKRINRN